VSHLWLSHFSRANDSCPTYERVECPTYARVTSHRWHWHIIATSSTHHTATHCNTLQHTTTHCNTLQHTATHCNTLTHHSDIFDTANESCHTYERILSHIWLSHTPPHINESCPTHERVMSHRFSWNVILTFLTLRMRHVVNANESHSAYDRVMSHIYTSHVRHLKESCPTSGTDTASQPPRHYEWVMSHIWPSRVLSLAYDGVMSHTWTTHVPHTKNPVLLVNESCPIDFVETSFCSTCERLMFHMWMSHFAHMHESRPTDGTDCGTVMLYRFRWHVISTSLWIYKYIHIYIHIHIYPNFILISSTL